jgi:hypothetical protein
MSATEGRHDGGFGLSIIHVNENKIRADLRRLADGVFNTGCLLETVFALTKVLHRA